MTPPAFHSPERFAFVAELERHWQRIRDEYLGVQRELVDWVERELYGDGWQVYGLYDFPHGEPMQENIAYGKRWPLQVQCSAPISTTLVERSRSSEHSIVGTPSRAAARSAWCTGRVNNGTVIGRLAQERCRSSACDSAMARRCPRPVGARWRQDRAPKLAASARMAMQPSAR